jgi:regulator of replication initiation timing
MNKTKYPISKIRSGKVAVKLTDFDQFKKIAPERDLQYYEFKSYYRADYYHGYLANEFQWIPFHFKVEYTLIDFSQIDWEEVKEETVEEAIKREYEARKFNSDFPFEPQSFKIGAKWQKEQLDKELSSLKAENERLKRDMGDITRKNVELVLENETLSSKNATLAANYFESYQQLQQQQTSQSQELSLRQRMAWEYLKENPQVGVEKSFKYIDNFLNYKGGNDEQ